MPNVIYRYCWCHQNCGHWYWISKWSCLLDNSVLGWNLSISGSSTQHIWPQHDGIIQIAWPTSPLLITDKILLMFWIWKLLVNAAWKSCKPCCPKLNLRSSAYAPDTVVRKAFCPNQFTLSCSVLIYSPRWIVTKRI